MDTHWNWDYYWPCGGYFASEFKRDLCAAAAKGDAALVRDLFARLEPEGPLLKNWRLPLVLACRAGSSDAIQVRPPLLLWLPACA